MCEAESYTRARAGSVMILVDDNVKFDEERGNGVRKTQIP